MKSRRLLKSRKGVRLVYHSPYCHYCTIYGGFCLCVHHIPWGTRGYKPMIINKIILLGGCRYLVCLMWHELQETFTFPCMGWAFMLHKRCGFLMYSFTVFMRRTTQLARTHVTVMWFCSIELCVTLYSSTKRRAGYWSNLVVFDFLQEGDKVAVDIGCKIKCLLKGDSSTCQQKEPQISFDMQTLNLQCV